MYKKYFIITILIILSSLVFITSCDKEEEKETNIDETIYDFTKQTTGYTWFENSDELLNTTSLSGHAEPLMRVRYNNIASNQLTDSKRVIDGAVFEEGSVIIKELYTNVSSLTTYAIMYKKQDNEFADSNGWLWSIFSSDGTVEVSAKDKGTMCISCHSSEGHIDYTLMNAAHP